jgi:malonyl-CoA decarboxylase
MNTRFFQDVLGSIAERGRSLKPSTSPQPAGDEHAASEALAPTRLERLCRALLSQLGEASGVALAQQVLDQYRRLPIGGRLDFFRLLARDFNPDRTQLRAAWAAYDADPTPESLQALLQAVEPPRQELFRRLNLAPGGTAALVAMREDLLKHGSGVPELKSVDNDFDHLLGSWFNRGFLVLRHIDWSTPADILERIIRYEAVHEIRGWEDLRRRLQPIDRRCFGFFHPSLVDEPLIFVEVALTREIPSTIAILLAEKRDVVPPAEQKAAVFYSISNTQVGLRGVSFGNFLIKQVAEELKREIPSLETFVTLSPVPGFAAWLGRERKVPNSEALTDADHDALALLDDPGWAMRPAVAERLRDILMPLAAHYFLRSKNRDGWPVDPVARFHLGNGARLERLNWLGDVSANGMRRSHGLMVNYLYALDDVERQHEAYTNEGLIAASASVRSLLRSGRSV